MKNIFIIGNHKSDTIDNISKSNLQIEKAMAGLIKKGWNVFSPFKNFEYLFFYFDDFIFSNSFNKNSYWNNLIKDSLKNSDALYLLEGYDQSELCNYILNNAKNFNLAIFLEKDGTPSPIEINFRNDID
jgi:hypothetical protein